MYNVIENADTKFRALSTSTRKRGRGNKTDERMAIEGLKAGQGVVIPKDKAPRGSVQNWVWVIGKKNGLLLSVISRDDEWLIVARERAG